ncbi:UDP-2,3-diacylglucosamine diphosphatase [Verminephrobacter eiseniae]|uniref:UDP-2,3-diacylglucosamine diphosphatase n=1 Tax=Verminephrobacter eiseniae TaxID=364317 RepID=UPI0022386BD1|nr:UDP-2,3-diacylglucosamine diphosphatase [Verminephrobacter eiseniae]MCW5258887.1 UDP-2,3-diacylglucosamine diphosphatase [Verminephrobacter eiseniae]
MAAMPAVARAMRAGLPRFGELAAPAHWRRVDVVSDLHLQASDPATLAAWQHYLQTTPADALFILGDLFEVWVGDDAIDDSSAGQPSFEARGCAALQAPAQRLAMYFMPGNRDFLAGPAFLAHCGITGLADPSVLVFGGQRILLSHGDRLCVDDVDYQRLRVQLRSARWQQRFLAQPLAMRREQARAMRQQSAARKLSGLSYADVDDLAAVAWLNAAAARTLIHGHTHRPAEHPLGGGLRRVVLSDWDAAARPARAQVLRLALTGAAAPGWERLALL